MIEGIGYVGAGWCRKCDAVRIRMPQHRRRVCGECGTTIDSPLLLRDAGWPAGLRIDWADRRPQMDADSVRSRLMLVAGDYIERRSFAAQDDTLAAVEGLRADNSGVVRYPASEDEGSPASATLADRMALELRHAAGVARLRAHERGPNGTVLRSAVAMHIEALATMYAQRAADAAAWTITQSRIVALAGCGATLMAVHDPERNLWAARTPQGETVAIAPVVDGVWNGELYTPETEHEAVGT